MKSTKKVLAVLLATAMLFAICAMSAFAEAISTNEEYNNIEADYFYHVNKIQAEGTLEYKPATHSVVLRVFCKNVNYYDISEYHLFAQCLVNYTDGSQDFFTVSTKEFIAQDDRKSTLGEFWFPTGKTVESFDAEFFIWYENEPLWEAYIYSPLT